VTLIRRDFLGFGAGALALAALPTGVLAAGADKGYAEGEMALGAEDAPVTIIEYASMTCPHCARFHLDTFGKLKSAYIDTGKVRFLFREFPLDGVALQASVLARCAGPKRFFAFIDVLFEQQETWSRANDPTAALARIGRLGGVGAKKFQACMSDRDLGDSILKTRLEGGSEYEISGTPTFIVNDKKHEGGYDFPTFERLLKPLLPES
jgi:protein-disulfide isomerase